MEIHEIIIKSISESKTSALLLPCEILNCGCKYTLYNDLRNGTKWKLHRNTVSVLWSNFPLVCNFTETEHVHCALCNVHMIHIFLLTHSRESRYLCLMKINNHNVHRYSAMIRNYWIIKCSSFRKIIQIAFYPWVHFPHFHALLSFRRHELKNSKMGKKKYLSIL